MRSSTIWAFLGVDERVFYGVDLQRHSDLRQRLKRERIAAVSNSKATGGADKELMEMPILHWRFAEFSCLQTTDEVLQAAIAR